MNLRPTIMLLTIAAACGGCTHIITADTPYYNDGPEQLDPPQGDVAKGTWCLVVGERGDYYRIWGGGVNAFVWKRAVAPLLEFQKDEKDRADEAERQKRLKRAGVKPPPTSQPVEQPARL